MRLIGEDIADMRAGQSERGSLVDPPPTRHFLPNLAYVSAFRCESECRAKGWYLITIKMARLLQGYRQFAFASAL